MGRAPFGIEGALKISLGVGGPIPDGGVLKDFRVGHSLLGGLEIMFVIGGETEFAAGFQGNGQITHEGWLHQSPRPVASLRPRVGKHDVDNGDAAGWQEVFNRVTEFEAEDANIGQVRPGCAFFDLADAAEESLDGEKIDFGMLLRVGEGEASVTRAEIELDGVIVAPQLRPVETLAGIPDEEAMR